MAHLDPLLRARMVREHHLQVTDDELADRVDAAIIKGRAVAHRPLSEQYMSSTDRLASGAYTEWRAQSLALLRSTFDTEHVYVVQFSIVTEPAVQNDPRADEREAGVGVLAAALDDIRSGHLQTVRSLVSAEVFGDFLSMADHLAGQGYHHAAASLAGAVLEDGLRRALRQRDLKSTGNLESMNQVALDQKVYGPMTYKQVKVWIDIRNRADHGQFEAVESDRVGAMLRDLPGFLSKELGIG